VWGRNLLKVSPPQLRWQTTPHLTMKLKSLQKGGQYLRPGIVVSRCYTEFEQHPSLLNHDPTLYPAARPQ